jgi:hypothetical protein
MNSWITISFASQIIVLHRVVVDTIGQISFLSFVVVDLLRYIRFYYYYYCYYSLKTMRTHSRQVYVMIRSIVDSSILDVKKRIMRRLIDWWANTNYGLVNNDAILDHHIINTNEAQWIYLMQCEPNIDLVRVFGIWFIVFISSNEHVHRWIKLSIRSIGFIHHRRQDND